MGGRKRWREGGIERNRNGRGREEMERRGYRKREEMERREREIGEREGGKR